MPTSVRCRYGCTGPGFSTIAEVGCRHELAEASARWRSLSLCGGGYFGGAGTRFSPWRVGVLLLSLTARSPTARSPRRGAARPIGLSAFRALMGLVSALCGRTGPRRRSAIAEGDGTSCSESDPSERESSDAVHGDGVEDGGGAPRQAASPAAEAQHSILGGAKQLPSSQKAAVNFSLLHD